MDREEIIRMAREAAENYTQNFNWEYMPQIDKDIFERFATLVAAHEREACAKVCDGMDHNGVMIAADCAAAIRARGNT